MSARITSSSAPKARTIVRDEGPGSDLRDGSLPHYHSVGDVADALGISVSHLRREIRLRRIAIVRLGRMIRISPAAVQDYAAARQRKARG